MFNSKNIMDQHIIMSYETDLIYLITLTKNTIRFDYNGEFTYSVNFKDYQFKDAFNRLSKSFEYIGTL